MAPPAVVAMLLVIFFVPPSRDPSAPRLDVLGLALSTVTIGLLVYTVIEAPGRGWSAASTMAEFAGAAVALIVFVVWERRQSEPMLEVELFKNLRFSAASGAISVALFALLGFIFLITMYFQFLHGYSPFSTGLRLIPVAVAIGVFSGVGPTLAVRLGNNRVVGAGLALMAIGFAWISTSNAETSYLEMVGQMLVSSAGLGLATAPAT